MGWAAIVEGFSVHPMGAVAAVAGLTAGGLPRACFAEQSLPINAGAIKCINCPHESRHGLWDWFAGEIIRERPTG